MHIFVGWNYQKWFYRKIFCLPICLQSVCLSDGCGVMECRAALPRYARLGGVWEISSSACTPWLIFVIFFTKSPLNLSEVHSSLLGIILVKSCQNCINPTWLSGTTVYQIPSMPHIFTFGSRSITIYKICGKVYLIYIHVTVNQFKLKLF